MGENRGAERVPCRAVGATWAGSDTDEYAAPHEHGDALRRATARARTAVWSPPGGAPGTGGGCEKRARRRTEGASRERGMRETRRIGSGGRRATPRLMTRDPAPPRLLRPRRARAAARRKARGRIGDAEISEAERLRVRSAIVQLLYSLKKAARCCACPDSAKEEAGSQGASWLKVDATQLQGSVRK